MHSTRSTWSRYGSIASNGVSGLAASPTRSPRPRICVEQRPVPPISTCTVHRVGPGVPERLQVLAGVGHHEVAVEEEPRVPAQRGDHRRPDGEVGHEVGVHDVHVQPVGRAGDLAHRLGEVAEVGREHRRRDLERARGARVARGVDARLTDRAYGRSGALRRNRAQHRMRLNA